MPHSQKPVRQDALFIASIIAVAARLIVWFGTMIVPIPNESGQAISPLHANSDIDLSFYQKSRIFYGTWLDRFAETPLEQWWSLIKAFWFQASSSFVSGPLMSGLLALFDYGPTHTLPLAGLYLLISCAIVLAWLWWLHKMGLHLFGLLVVALMPGPFWFMLNVSSDLPFAGLFTIFFLVFFSDRPARQRYIYATAIAVIATLLRPHGISLLLFLGLYGSMLSPGRTNAQRVAVVAVTLVVGGIMLWLSNRYFLAYLHTSAQLPYFERTTAEYLSGVFSFLPSSLDKLLSWIALPSAKLLYLAGIRPSYGQTLEILVLIRAASGLILLAGLLYGFFRAPWAYRFLLVAFFAPVALGAAQDRYLLAFTPLMVFFAARMMHEVLGIRADHKHDLRPLPLQGAARDPERSSSRKT